MTKIYAQMKQKPNIDRGSPLALFSYLVVAVVQKLGKDAYGLRITQELMELLGTLIDPGQTYLALKRLEARGFLSRKDVRGREGAGVVRVYALTGDGIRAFAKTKEYIEVAASIGAAPDEERKPRQPRRGLPASLRPHAP